ncbi:MAG: prepilin-type N-terminal cleavage/methylation domain-containing protein [Gammaproteobacteria bacterium]|nr:prepilin-type N-terminal cleavage/methylation domain-containing protein [Gammaproteobacteria bacterium]
MPTMKRLPGRFGKLTGFSLVELMISIVVGLIVVAGVISIFSSTIKSYTDNLRMTRLNQELRVAMDLMVRDIRRAGYRGDANVALISASDQNPYASKQSPQDQDNLSITGSCITFSYDKNGNYSSASPPPPGKVALVETEDRSGFRLLSGAIQWRYGASSPSTVCSSTTGNWKSITDGNTVNITALNFSFVPYPPPGIRNTTISGAFRYIRGVTITLTGELVNDPNIKRTITEMVRVQNDAYYFP